jgi:protein-tyrosine phosphatase
LTSLAPDESAWLASLDPAAIIDFRGEAEALHSVVDLPPSLQARRLALPIVAETASRFRAIMAEGEVAPDAFAAVMTQAYREFVSTHAETYVRFIRTVAAAGERPVLFHCTAGKDRTGVAAALILTALGVPRATIMQDYLATATLWQPDERIKAQMPTAAHAAVFGVEPVYLNAAFEQLDRTGGIAGFVRDAIGGEDARREFATRHLEPA